MTAAPYIYIHITDDLRPGKCLEGTLMLSVSSMPRETVEIDHFSDSGVVEIA